MLIRRLTLLGCIALLAIAVTGVVLAATTPVQKEVRITARLLESGKVEFGLQERTDGGEWGEILLPTKNKFPYATADVDRWLRSSPVVLTPVEFETVDEGMGEVEEPETAPEPEAEEPEETVDSPFGQWEYRRVDGSVSYFLRDEEGLGSLHFDCRSAAPKGPLARVVTNVYLVNDRDTDDIDVVYRLGDGEFQSETWWSDERFHLFFPVDSTLFLLEPEGFVRFLSFSATQSTTFVFATIPDRYARYYIGHFDLTGIHAVLEALPCFSTT